MNKSENLCGSELISISKAYANVHGYVSLIICVIGIVGNVLNIIIFGRREMISPVNIILRSLSTVDLIVLIFYIPFSWNTFVHHKVTDRELFSYYWAVFVFYYSYISQIFHCIGIWLTVVLAVWRYVAIAHPLRNKFWCNTTSTKRAAIAGYIICPILCTPIIYSFRIQEEDYFVDQFDFKTSKGNVTKLYVVGMVEPVNFIVKLNFIIYSVLLRLVPSILLIAVNVKLICALMQNKKRRKYLTLKAIERQKQMDRITRMLVAVLFLFLINEIPQSVLILLVVFYGQKILNDCYGRIGNILDILALINSSIHFFLYYIMSRQYRDSFEQVICKRKPTRKNNSSLNDIITLRTRL